MEVKAANNWFHILCQFIVASFCLYWYWHPPAPNKAVLILTGVTVVIALFDMRAGHKTVYLLLIICLMSIENRAINKDRADAAALEDSRRIEENTKFQTIAVGLTTSIQQNQAQFAATTSEIKENIDTITGGDSFCYIQFAPLTNERGFAFALQSGRFPLYGVHARIVDEEKFARLHPPGKPLTIENAFLGDINLEVGDLAAGTAKQLSYIDFSNSEKENFNIFFSAHNGLWTELLRMRKIHGGWKIATKVTRLHPDKNGRLEDYTVFEKVDAQYPRVNGKVDW